MVLNEEGNMIITLRDKELTEAVTSYVKNRYGLDDTSSFNLTLKSGRKTKKNPYPVNTITVEVSTSSDSNAPVQLELPLEAPVEVVEPAEELETTEVLEKEEEVLEEPIEAPKIFHNPALKDIEEQVEQPVRPSLFA